MLKKGIDFKNPSSPIMNEISQAGGLDGMKEDHKCASKCYLAPNPRRFKIICWEGLCFTTFLATFPQPKQKIIEQDASPEGYLFVFIFYARLICSIFS